MIKTLIALALMASASAANAQLITVEKFTAYDGTVNTAHRHFTNWSKPVTLTQAGTYRFDVTMTTNNTKGQGYMDFAVEYGSAASGYNNAERLQFQKNLDPSGQVLYVGTFEFSAKARDTFKFIADFNPTGGATGKVDFNLSRSVAPVPEPETYALMGLGLVGLFAARRRKSA